MSFFVVSDVYFVVDGRSNRLDSRPDQYSIITGLIAQCLAPPEPRSDERPHSWPVSKTASERRASTDDDVARHGKAGKAWRRKARLIGHEELKGFWTTGCSGGLFDFSNSPSSNRRGAAGANRRGRCQTPSRRRWAASYSLLRSYQIGTERRLPSQLPLQRYLCFYRTASRN